MLKYTINQKMVRVGLILSLFCICINFSSTAAVTFAATQTTSVTQRNCFITTATVNYTANVNNITNPPVGSYVCGTDYNVNLTSTKFELRAGTLVTGTLLATKYGNQGIASCVSASGGMNLLGSFDLSNTTTYPTGIYTIFATIYVNDITEGRSKIVTTQTTFMLGYEVAWTDLIDMSASPNSYSAKRNTTTVGQTYGGLRSLNLLPSASGGWIDLGPQFTSTATTGSVYIVLGKTTNTSTFNPSATGVTYVEYRKTGASTASVYIRNGVTNTTSVALTSMGITSRIRISKTGTTLKFYYGNTNTLITNATDVTGFTSPINVAVFSSNVNDGVRDVTTDFLCSFNNQYYLLKDEVDESYAYITDTELRFKFEEEYFDVTGLLSYSIKNLNTDVITTGTVTKSSHSNWVKLNLGASPGLALTTGQIYLLEVVDVNRNKKFLKFKFQS